MTIPTAGMRECWDNRKRGDNEIDTDDHMGDFSGETNGWMLTKSLPLQGSTENSNPFHCQFSWARIASSCSYLSSIGCALAKTVWGLEDVNSYTSVTAVW